MAENAADKDLAKEQQETHPLSPDLGDVAVSSFSSFSAFHGGSARPPRAVAQSPPNHIIAQQNDALYSSISSMDAIAAGESLSKDVVETEDELFAVKMSPRSPEMTKSPFSFSTNDTVPWAKGVQGNE